MILPLLLSISSCGEGDIEDSLFEEGEQFPGGATTIVDGSRNSFGNAAPNLTGDKDITFAVGNAIFNRNWVTAPASTEDLDGIGPVFNARSCSGCHIRDGRGRPPIAGEDFTLGLLFRLSIPGTSPTTGAPIGHPNYGGQLNPRSILGVPEEGKVNVSYVEVEREYPDGETYSLRMPLYEFVNLGYGEISDAMVSPRVANHMIGLGLLEAISENDLLAVADESDVDGDGISGKPNRVWDVASQQHKIGRFGWKANEPSVRQQVAGAFLGDIGITSSLFPNEPCSSLQQDCLDAPSGGVPELREEFLDAVTFYSSSLAVPRRRDYDKPEVLRGKQLFNEAKCASCHIPKWITSESQDIPEFGGQTIWPYTDLLLHDMGEALADNRPDFEATGTEWRTPPLWGLGLVETVNNHSFLLHDGRARGFEEAILWHGGEAEASKQFFERLEKEDREAVVEFLKSL